MWKNIQQLAWLYTTICFTDSEDQNGNIKQGEWRSAVDGGQSVGNMLPLRPVRGRRYQNDALSMRDALKTYVNREEGSVSWQVDYVRRTAHYATQLQFYFMYISLEITYVCAYVKNIYSSHL